ncbi:hypothetical protein RQP46_000446 [Phenoliferia psychrophenolica]
MSSTELFLLSVLLALVTHRICQKHEVRKDPPPPPPDAALFFAAWVVNYQTLTTILIVRGQSLVSASTSTLYAAVVFVLSLAASIAIRRVWFHPLAQYPGPKLARLSRIWNVRAVMSTKHHLIVQDLHQQHGPVVRIGPNELSFATVDAIPFVLGREGGLNRGSWYIFISRSVTDHIRLRRVWDKALGPAA